jgi:hypothetical protein
MLSSGFFRDPTMAPVDGILVAADVANATLLGFVSNALMNPRCCFGLNAAS